jgi:hypothetical protein
VLGPADLDDRVDAVRDVGRLMDRELVAPIAEELTYPARPVHGPAAQGPLFGGKN